MKKNFVYAMMSAIALTGAVCFSSCSSSDELSDVNPTYDGESVKTTFTISIGDVTSPTRMATTAVQGETPNPVFEGMTDIYLFPFKGTVEEDALISESYIHLADFDGFDNPVKKAQGKIYNDVALSVGVNNFLFYGAIDSDKKGNGELKPSYLDMTDPASNYWKQSTWDPSPVVKGTTTVGDLTFDLVPIRRGWTVKDVRTDEKAVLTITPLKNADAALANQISAATTALGEEHNVVKELKTIQKTLRNEVTSGTYKAYAGSSKSIKNLMEMLYNALKNKETILTAGTTPTNYASSIITAIENGGFTAEPNTDGYYVLSWTDPGFPANLGVPDGAAAVQYVVTNPDPEDTGFTPGFQYVKTSVEGLAVPSIDSYTYPARLYYTVNSPSKVLPNIFLKDAGDAYDTWADLAAEYTDGAVAADTRSVIMKNQVQYAVGRLDVYVKVKPATVLKDNSADAPQPVSVPSGGYELTGVLIGGQKQVGWDFTPISDADEMTIWDNKMTSTITAKQDGDSFAGPNHTLALETTSGQGSAVNIALEFVNTGNDFCGVDHNLIPAGTKFYLVAQLDPSSNITYKEQNPETPWTDGTNLIKQVIKQDYVTTVNLTIGELSLQKAYNVVPDLRSPKLEFGLSVDLHWRKGITFDVEF